MNTKNLMMMFLGLMSASLFTACGANTTTTTAATATGTCSTGYIYSATYASCLEQTSTCSGNYGLYNNACVYLGTTTVSTTTGSTTCSSGYIYSTTYASCLAQTSTCTGSYAMYNNSCVYAGVTTTTTTTHTPYQGSCNSGYVQTAAGCLTQGVCTTGYGYGSYGGTPWCFQATTSY